MTKTAYGIAAAAVILAGCHTITEKLPSEPSEPVGGLITVPIPPISVGATPTPSPKPTASPSPTPSPGATPTPTPTPEPSPTATPPPGGSGCGNPLPPPVTRIKVKIHLKGPTRWTLDSTPLVGPNKDYCRKIGYTDGRDYCPVRPEGAPDRSACETYAIGRAEDTGRPGPTWYRNGKYCTGEASGCENHEDNQYLLWTYLSGTYAACANTVDVCGSVEVSR
jgi:hypothetical protein